MNRIYNESNLETMRRMDDCSIDAVVTDPPYELGFMGKHWDSTGIAYSVEMWREVLRVLKPGGHLLSFGGSRTYHRMACAIEDAGFEIRDMVEWTYGSGFPKSLNIGKAVDERLGNERIITGKNPAYRPNEYVWNQGGGKTPMRPMFKDAGSSQWEGWGTALKPAHEPICLARKPLNGTVADNVLKYGTGGLNIDGCRVETDPNVDDMLRTVERKKRESETWENGSGFKNENNKLTGVPSSGRFPANIIHDGSPEVLAMFPDNKGAAAPVASGQKGFGGKIYGKYNQTGDDGATFYGDGMGSAARFFYCAKASPAERNMGCEGIEAKVKDSEYRQPTGNPMVDRIHGCGSVKSNHHPTVKPIALMKYLVKLITPPCGIVYDPFTGSGSTLIAAKQLGFNFIGSELQPEYCEIANARISTAEIEKTITSNQLSLL